MIKNGIIKLRDSVIADLFRNLLIVWGFRVKRGMTEQFNLMALILPSLIFYGLAFCGDGRRDVVVAGTAFAVGLAAHHEAEFGAILNIIVGDEIRSVCFAIEIECFDINIFQCPIFGGHRELFAVTHGHLHVFHAGRTEIVDIA